MRRYRRGAHTKYDLKVHLVWIPKYRKKILIGPVAVRVRNLIRQIAMEQGVVKMLLKGREKKNILPLTGNQTKSTRVSERRYPMGLYKRGKVWWMSLVYKGRRVRRSTEVADRKLAQKIYDKVKWEIVSGKWFERLPEENRTFREMMEKFKEEHISQKASARPYLSHAKTLISYFGDYLEPACLPVGRGFGDWNLIDG